MYARVRRACLVYGMSIREASRWFGLHWYTVRKMLAYSVSPSHLPKSPPRPPKHESVSGTVDAILEADAGFGYRANQRGDLV